MGTLTPAQMYDHSLDVIKGPSLMHRLDFHAAPATGTDLNAGSVCSLNSSGELVAGVAVGSAINRPMPMFAIQATDDFDANSDVGNISGGVQGAVVATGGFEVETTEYVTSYAYKVNDLITAATGGDVGSVRAATVGPYTTEVMVGCVSTGLSTNADGKSVLRFWTIYLPAGTAGHLAESTSSGSSSSSSNSSSSS